MSWGSGTPAFEGYSPLERVDEPLMDGAEIEALRLLFHRYAGQPFKLEQVNAAAAGSVSGAELRAALPALLRSGAISAVRKAWGEKLYYLPLDRLLGMVNAWGYVELREQDPARVELSREAKPGLALDLFRALTWISGNGLRMTAKGTIHQKECSKLEERLAIKAEDLVGLRLKYPHADVYSPALAVVLDLLQALGLIAKERAIWRIHPPGLAAWLSLDLSAMNLVLLRELLQRYVPADAGLQHVALRLAAPDLKPGVWYALEELLGSLQDQGLLGLEGEPSPERAAWIEGWLEALCGCGWLELGRHPEDGAMFRWLIERDTSASAASAATKGKLIVQPDFELFVPPDVPFAVRFELEACAELVSSGVMSVYRLTRSGLEQACRLGRTAQEILQLLEAHSAFVPEPVRDALLQWGREIGRTTLADAKLLSCADADAADRIASLSQLADQVKRIGPLHFLVNPDREAEVLKILDGERLAPVHRRTSDPDEPTYPKLAEVLTEDGEAFTRQDGQGWIYQGADLHFYEPELGSPSVEELFPGLSEIPAMWWKELRRYHASTARELVERALAWRTKLMLQIGGETVLGVPLVAEGDADWRVKLRLLSSSGNPEQETVLSPEDWQAIRLILPAGIR
ncbi:MAG: helicase-associated domain-containing protein [Paenibacillus sp.]|uniref:helicase-associated domain-containing protein n=1 Tax=Paenibacillus sp. TaxID=58172 RepID=UPI0029113B82|nr:helicase-associated domain-containing protein [Paenibacillus sp.]MDU4697752.1 helicase-associated domain-containing protein [Paenibacillus sp.]